MMKRSPGACKQPMALAIGCLLGCLQLVAICPSSLLSGAESATLPAAVLLPAATRDAAHADYKLYPGDLLKMSVFDHPDLSVELRIPVSGAITVPLIGRVDGLVGRTMSDFGAEITKRLEADYLQQAVVTLTVTDFGPRLAYVLGSVRTPTSVKLNAYADVSALQAISEAGGFAADGNRAAAIVLREDLSTGQLSALPVPASDRPEDIRRDVVLVPRDIVLVPRLDRAYVMGRVLKPGAIDIPSEERISLTKAISLAGGFDKYARQTDVQLIREGRRLAEVNVQALLNGDAPGAEDPVLKPGDTVYIPEARF